MYAFPPARQCQSGQGYLLQSGKTPNFTPVMKKILIVPFFLLPLCSNAQAVDSLRACIDSAIVCAKQISLYRNNVSWEDVEAQMHWRAGLAENVLDLRPAFQYLLEQLNDPHGRFFFNQQPIVWYQGDVKPYQQHIDPKVWGVIQSGKYPFQYAMLPNNTGYLRVPGMQMGDNAQLAAPILSAICSLQTLGARQWVVDLRFNGGGNMYPMLAGLAPLLGDGDVGGSQDATGNRFSTWTIKEGDMLYNDVLRVDMENRCPMEQAPKVAVLTSRYTVSSGEIVAVAFKGRPDTRFFGEHTAGFTTETNWVGLPAGVTMSIAISYFADRQGRVYREYIPVDEEIEFVPDTPIQEDDCIRKALEWLGK